MDIQISLATLHDEPLKERKREQGGEDSVREAQAHSESTEAAGLNLRSLSFSLFFFLSLSLSLSTLSYLSLSLSGFCPSPSLCRIPLSHSLLRLFFLSLFVCVSFFLSFFLSLSLSPMDVLHVQDHVNPSIGAIYHTT